MTKYKISIIIPAFNLENKINRAFDSIKNQTLGFEDLEIIFVDDNSKDGTFKIIKNLADTYENVSAFITDENSGYAGKPRNIGLEHAKSDYVLFLDGDDELLKDSCEVLYDKITSTNSDIVIGGQINVFDGIHQHNPPLSCGIERIFNDMKDQELLNIRPAISAKLFKKELLIENNIRFPEGISGQDLVFLMKSMLNSKRVAVLNQFYVYYRILSNDSVTFDISEKYLKGLIKACTLVCETFDEFEVPQEIQERAIHQHISFFTSQTIRTNVESNEIMLYELFNSELFQKLVNQNVFKNNKQYRNHFNKMSDGEYDDTIIKKIKEEFDKDNINSLEKTDEEWDELYQRNKQLESELSKLKEELDSAKFNLAKIEDENIYLKKDNILLSEKCKK